MDIEASTSLNIPATALMFDLRNSTYLYKHLNDESQRKIIIDMLKNIHQNVLEYLYEKSGIDEMSFAFNDTGDGYLIVFHNELNALSCILCACYLREYLSKILDKVNKKLGIEEEDRKRKYGFGIGVHSAYIQILKLMGDKIQKSIPIGNAANVAARVEQLTKMPPYPDLIITGGTRKKAQNECDVAGFNENLKQLFDEKSSFLNKIHDRYKIKDYRSKGYNIYQVKPELYIQYNKLVKY